MLTVAKAGWLLVHVPAVEGVTLAVLATQTAVAPANTGAVGAALITTLPLEAEVHVPLLTLKVYVAPAGKLDSVVLVVVPVVVILPGVLVIVQLPVGKPLNTTEPVGLVQLGWVIVPTVGAVGRALMVMFLVAEHPSLVLV